MRIHIEHNDTVFEYEHRPMPEGRFRALCSLALAAIIGAVLLGLAYMLGVWGLVWPVGTVAMYGLYKLFVGVFVS